MKALIPKFIPWIDRTSVNIPHARSENNKPWQVTDARVFLVSPLYSLFCLLIPLLEFQLGSLDL